VEVPRLAPPHVPTTDGIIDAITDWAGCGLYGGFRNTEWAQDDCHADLENPQLDIHGKATAFRLDDIIWQTPTKVRLPLDSVLANESAVARATLTFKAQKNGDNGATRLFTRNDYFPDMCFIRLFSFALYDAFCAWCWAKTIPNPFVFAEILSV
jgi:hypothetical protein